MEEKDFTLKDLIIQVRETFQFLLSKWKVIVVVGLLGGVLGLTKSLLTEPTYVGVVKFVVEEDKKGGGLASLASSFGLGGAAEGSVFSAANMVEILKTRAMVEEALLRPVREKKYSDITYAELYIQTYQMHKMWDEDANLKNIRYKVDEDRLSFSRAKDSILGSIYENMIGGNQLDVSPPNKNNSILSIDVNTQSEVFSKNFATELIDVAAIYYSESKTKKAKISVAVLQNQVDSVKNVMYSSMSGAASASDEVFGLNPAMNVQRVASIKQQNQVQMSMIVLQELVKNLELAKMKLRDDTPIINVIDKPVYPLEKKQLGFIKAIIIGGIIAGFLIVLFLIGRKYWITNLERLE